MVLETALRVETLLSQVAELPQWREMAVLGEMALLQTIIPPPAL
jgi:hypothetical protein